MKKSNKWLRGGAVGLLSVVFLSASPKAFADIWRYPDSYGHCPAGYSHIPQTELFLAGRWDAPSVGMCLDRQYVLTRNGGVQLASTHGCHMIADGMGGISAMWGLGAGITAIIPGAQVHAAAFALIGAGFSLASYFVRQSC